MPPQSCSRQDARTSRCRAPACTVVPCSPREQTDRARSFRLAASVPLVRASGRGKFSRQCWLRRCPVRLGSPARSCPNLPRWAGGLPSWHTLAVCGLGRASFGWRMVRPRRRSASTASARTICSRYQPSLTVGVQKKSSPPVLRFHCGV